MMNNCTLSLSGSSKSTFIVVSQSNLIWVFSFIDDRIHTWVTSQFKWFYCQFNVLLWWNLYIVFCSRWTEKETPTPPETHSIVLCIDHPLRCPPALHTATHTAALESYLFIPTYETRGVIWCMYYACYCEFVLSDCFPLGWWRLYWWGRRISSYFLNYFHLSGRQKRLQLHLYRENCWDLFCFHKWTWIL